MTDEQLNEIKLRCDKATPGPWDYDGAHDEITTPNSEDDYWLICSECRTAPNDAPVDNFGHQFSPDFDFIAHAREDVPELVASLERARMALRELRKYNPQHHDLDSYLLNFAEWGLGEIDEKPDPEYYGVTP